MFYRTESSDSELEEDESVQEGVYYLLKELAFIISSKEMFGTNKIAVIYHRSWPVYEKFVNGDYDGDAKEGLGLAIINYDLCCWSCNLTVSFMSKHGRNRSGFGEGAKPQAGSGTGGKRKWKRLITDSLKLVPNVYDSLTSSTAIMNTPLGDNKSICWLRFC